MREEYQRKSYWVDGRGQWLEDRLKNGGLISDNPEFDKPYLAISQLGLVNVYYDIDTIHVCWDVKAVCSSSIEAVRAYLERICDKTRIVLKFFFGAWRTETFEVTGPAIERINQTRCYKEVDSFSETIVVRQELSKKLCMSEWVMRGLAAWKRLDGAFKGFHDAEQKKLMNNMLIVVHDNISDRYLYGHIGSQSVSREMLGAPLCNRLLGKDVITGGINHSFYRAVSNPYYELINSNKPRIDHVLAKVHADNKAPKWHSYERALLPSRLIDGTPALVIISEFSDSISVPFMGR